MVNIKIRNVISISILFVLVSSMVLNADFFNQPEEFNDVSKITFVLPSSIVIDGIMKFKNL